MASKGLLITTLILRIFALAFIAGSIVLYALDKFTVSDGTKTTFKDVHSYRYVVAAAVLGFVYTLFQIPFAIYHVSKEKRLIRHDCLPEFDFYADKLVSYILATAVAAGFAVTFEYKSIINQFEDSLEQLGFSGFEETESKGEKFFDKANIATGVLFLGFLCVAIQSVISSLTRTATSSRGFFG